ncbi:hypothetical protein PoB_002898100 [Plakobranchus ocellatus]|uniref:Uncharacterized protein n=1 Tax=Plakobranchus ocellatus TaxID=259542 RepID=A0AAV4A728_9GAST|nr:hypothetical protein PoB_002898100 [Plakobranchus ocellatus]
MDNRAEREDYHYIRNNKRQNYRRDAHFRPPYWSRIYAPRRIGDSFWQNKTSDYNRSSSFKIHLRSIQILPATTRSHLPGVLEALVVGDSIANLIKGNQGNFRIVPEEWLNDRHSDNDRKEQPIYANAVTEIDSRADTANASDQNKDDPKTELNCLDHNEKK